MGEVIFVSLNFYARWSAFE